MCSKLQLEVTEPESESDRPDHNETRMRFQ